MALVQPLMWIGCLMTAVIPAAFVVQVLSFAWPKPPTALALGAYLISPGLVCWRR